MNKSATCLYLASETIQQVVGDTSIYHNKWMLPSRVDVDAACSVQM